MRRANVRLDDFRWLIQRAGVIDQRLARICFTGGDKRYSRTEKVFPRLEKRRQVVSVNFEGRKVYIARRLCKSDRIFDLIGHHLAAAECMIRLYRADMSGIVVPQSEFYGMGSVPDQAIMYDKSMILIEFHTYDNFTRHTVEQKVSSYKRHLPGMEGYFKRTGIVVYVIDAPAEEIKELDVSDEQSFVVDFETFRTVSIGQQLTASIYIWGGDGQTYPLRHVQPESNPIR